MIKECRRLQICWDNFMMANAALLIGCQIGLQPIPAINSISVFFHFKVEWLLCLNSSRDSVLHAVIEIPPMASISLILPDHITDLMALDGECSSRASDVVHGCRWHWRLGIR